MSYQFLGHSDYESKSLNKTISRETIKTLLEHDSNTLLSFPNSYITDVQENFGIPLPAFPQPTNNIYDYVDEFDKNPKTVRDVPSPERPSFDQSSTGVSNLDSLLPQQDKNTHRAMFQDSTSQNLKFLPASVNLASTMNMSPYEASRQGKHDPNEINLINIAKSVSTLQASGSNRHGYYDHNTTMMSYTNPTNFQQFSLAPMATNHAMSTLSSTNANLYSYNTSKLHANVSHQQPSSTSSTSHSSDDSEDDVFKTTHQNQAQSKSGSGRNIKSRKRTYQEISKQNDSRSINTGKNRRSSSTSTLDRVPSHRDQENEDDEEDDENQEDKSNLSPEELKRRRLARKAELARLSRKYKKNRLACLEDEVVRLKQELAEARCLPSAQLRLDELQYMLQSLVQTIVPALSALSEQTHIPIHGIPTWLNGNGNNAYPGNPVQPTWQHTGSTSTQTTPPPSVISMNPSGSVHSLGNMSSVSSSSNFGHTMINPKSQTVYPSQPSPHSNQHSS